MKKKLLLLLASTVYSPFTSTSNKSQHKKPISKKSTAAHKPMDENEAATKIQRAVRAKASTAKSNRKPAAPKNAKGKKKGTAPAHATSPNPTITAQNALALKNTQISNLQNQLDAAEQQYSDQLNSSNLQIQNDATIQNQLQQMADQLLEKYNMEKTDENRMKVALILSSSLVALIGTGVLIYKKGENIKDFMKRAKTRIMEHG